MENCGETAAPVKYVLCARRSLLYIKGHANKWSRFAKSHRLCALFKQKRIVDNEKSNSLCCTLFLLFTHCVLSRYIYASNSFRSMGYTNVLLLRVGTKLYSNTSFKVIANANIHK